MLRNRRFVVALVAFSALGALLFAAACASQSEGDRCQLENGNDDCASGLVCTRSTDLPIDPKFRGQASDNEGRCCPTDRSKSTVAECAQTPAAPGGDAALPPAVDSGGADSPAPTTDSATDAPVGDAGQDAPIDAPADASDAG